MADPFQPKFVDLVRNSISSQGTGAFTLGPAVNGFTSFGAALTAGDRFHYCAVNSDKPGEREVGRGTLQADGTIAREVPGGSPTNFTSGTKSIALVAAAEWFTKTGSSGATPLFTEIATMSFPAEVDIVQTGGRTILGEYPARYVRDSDQTQYTARGSQLIAAAASQADAQADILAILDRIRVRDADGVYWVIDDESQSVHAGHFGAQPFAAYNPSNGAMLGVDNSAAIQALIDWRIYLKSGLPSSRRDCLIPPGRFKISKPIELGYGDTYQKVVLRGAGLCFDAGTMGGTLILCDFNNLPGIMIQGGRYSAVEDLAIVSGGLKWVTDKSLGALGNPAGTSHGIDDREISRWHDPSQPTRAARLRYNPHAGIAVDPLMGAAPTAATAWQASSPVAFGDYRKAGGKLYICAIGGTTGTSAPVAETDWIRDGTAAWHFVGPDSVPIAYAPALPPRFLPAAARVQYGRVCATSKPIIRKVNVMGFAVGVANKPSDDDGNADFVTLEDVHMSHCPVFVSIGGTQARNCNVVRFDGSRAHTVLTGTMHGRQFGRVEGTWLDCALAEIIQLYEIQAQASSGQLAFRNLYVEIIQRLGWRLNAGATGGRIKFDCCTLSFEHSVENGARGVPLSIDGTPLTLPAGSGGGASLILADTDLSNFRGVLPLYCQNVEIHNVRVSSRDQWDGVATQSMSRALNTLAGGVVVPRLEAKGDQRIRYWMQDETNVGSIKEGMTGRRNNRTSRSFPASLYDSTLSPGGSSWAGEEYPLPRPLFTFSKGSEATGLSLNGRTLTMTVAAGDWVLTRGLRPGAVLFDDLTGMVFFVETVGGTSGAYSVSAKLQNGYRYNSAGAIEYETAFAPGAGLLYMAGGGIFTPQHVLFGDISSGSAVIANCRRSDGYNGFITNSGASEVMAGDWPFVDQHADAWVGEGAVVSSIPAQGQITLSAAPTYSALQKPLPLWVRGS